MAKRPLRAHQPLSQPRSSDVDNEECDALQKLPRTPREVLEEMNDFAAAVAGNMGSAEEGDNGHQTIG